MVMEQHIVDESKIVSQRPPFDMSQMYSDLDEPNDFQFLSQQYRINKYQMENSKMSSQMQSPRKEVYLANRNLNRDISLQTPQYKQMSNRNNFKNRLYDKDSKMREQFFYQQNNKYLARRPKTQNESVFDNRVLVPNYGAKVP